MLSSLWSSETTGTPESKPRRYSADSLHGKGLQRLSYFVESRFVTRKFKNHLKHLGIFNPAYRRDDRREQVYVNRPSVRKYSDKISNRKFKLLWIKEHGGLKGLKDQPRILRRVEPLHVGTIDRAAGKFYRNPFLTKGERCHLSRPIRWARGQLKAAAKALRRKHRAEPGGNGPGQPATNPVAEEVSVLQSLTCGLFGVGRGSHVPLARQLSRNSYECIRDLAERYPDGSFRHYVFGPNGIELVKVSSRSLERLRLSENR